MNPDDDVCGLPQAPHGLAAGVFVCLNRLEIIPDDVGVPPYGFRRADPPAMDKNDFGIGHAGLHVRGIQQDGLAGNLPERQHAMAQDRKVVDKHAGVADRLVKNPRLPDGGRHPGNHVKQAPVPGDRIPAIDVPARIFKKVSVAVKGHIGYPIPVFGGKADDVGEQHQPISQPSGSERDDESFFIC